MSDSPYDALADLDVGLDTQWAFGTGFTDALAGVDTTVPAGLDAAALAAVCLMLGDDALVYSHRLQQWMTRAPELEEETALGNVALDLLGQARMLLARAGTADGTGGDEDAFAFGRDAGAFRTVRLVERRDADFAELVGRLLVVACWRSGLLAALAAGPDPVLAAIAAKGVVESTYHGDYAAGWVVRLGDGTEHSHARMRAGLAACWPHVDALFAAEPALAALGVDAPALRPAFDAALAPVLAAAGLRAPVVRADPTGRTGPHTAALSEVLTELQSVARAYPGARW